MVLPRLGVVDQSQYNVVNLRQMTKFDRIMYAIGMSAYISLLTAAIVAPVVISFETGQLWWLLLSAALLVFFAS